MGGGVFPVTTDELAILINELKDKLNKLESDFRKHDHGNTGSYAQGAITIRAGDATITGSKLSAQITTADTPRHPAGR